MNMLISKLAVFVASTMLFNTTASWAADETGNTQPALPLLAALD